MVLGDSSKSELKGDEKVQVAKPQRFPRKNEPLTCTQQCPLAGTCMGKHDRVKSQTTSQIISGVEASARGVAFHQMGPLSLGQKFQIQVDAALLFLPLVS